MTGRCVTCAHWERHRDTPEYSQDGQGRRIMLYVHQRWGECARAEGRDGQAADRSSLAYASDAESYGAGLCTHETFGCIQFEPKGADE